MSKCKCNNEDLDQEKDCKCSENCDCGEDCTCDKDHKCNENCTCGEEKSECECTCDFEHACECDEDCSCKVEEKDYLKDLLRVQAEFDNYRKRMTTSLSEARVDGFIDAIEQFLPAIDSFKMATDMITDKNTLMGIKFIEKGILDTLNKMGVEEIDATGMFNPELHQAVDTDTTSDAESGMITKVMFKGFTYKGKVIRYSQVVVKR